MTGVVSLSRELQMTGLFFNTIGPLRAKCDLIACQIGHCTLHEGVVKSVFELSDDREPIL